MKKYLISALVVAGLTFSGAASAKKLKFQMSSKLMNLNTQVINLGAL